MEDWIDFEIEEDSDDLRVYAWRVEQLGNLGIPTLIADAFADMVDWHEVAHLVDQGCPPTLALEISR